MVEYSDPRDFGFRPETVMTALMPYRDRRKAPGFIYGDIRR